MLEFNNSKITSPEIEEFMFLLESLNLSFPAPVINPRISYPYLVDLTPILVVYSAFIFAFFHLCFFSPPSSGREEFHGESF